MLGNSTGPLKRIKAFIQQVISIFNSNNGITLTGTLGICVDKDDNLYLSSIKHQILKMSPDGNVSLFAGALDGSSGSIDGTGTNSRFNGPRDLVCDSNGNIYVSDTGNHTIRKITPTGIVTTYAGVAGSSGSTNGTLGIGKFNRPCGLTIDPSNNLYVLDTGNKKIRKVDITQNITSLPISIQNSGYILYSGQLLFSNNILYWACDNDIQTNFTGILSMYLVTTSQQTAYIPLLIAGLYPGYADGIGSNARFSYPRGVAFDKNGDLFVADTSNNRIRKINMSNKEVTTITGSTAGDIDGSLLVAKFTAPPRMAFDSKGNLYVTNSQTNGYLRKILFNR